MDFGNDICRELRDRCALGRSDGQENPAVAGRGERVKVVVTKSSVRTTFQVSQRGQTIFESCDPLKPSRLRCSIVNQTSAHALNIPDSSQDKIVRAEFVKWIEYTAYWL